MVNRIVNTRIMLRRDNEANFDKIKDSFIPLNGEVVLIDTSNGLRAKVGTGTIALGNLPYTDEYARNIIQNGYFENNKFYDVNNNLLAGELNKIYVDRRHSKIYYYDGEKYVDIQEGITNASAESAGVVKLYNTLGYNEDGTMTQKAATVALEKKLEIVDINIDDEILVLKKG